MWMSLPELNIPRISPSGVCLLDYLYVFGGRSDNQQYITKIERLNLKNIASKWEVIET